MVKDIARASQKWSSGAVAAGPDYQAGVTGKGTVWQSNAQAAESLWAARIQEAIAAGSRSAGIARAGPSGWEQAAVQKGAPNYITGVRSPVAVQKYTQNFGPILQAIAAAVPGLPPRGAPMSPENAARAEAMWRAVHDAAAARKAGGYYTPTPTY